MASAEGKTTSRLFKKLKKQGKETDGSSDEEAKSKHDKKGKGGKGNGGGKGDVAWAEGGKTLSTKYLSLMVEQMNKLLLAHDDSILNLESIALVTFLLPEESPSMAAGRSEGQKYHVIVTSKKTSSKPEAPPQIYIAMAVIKKLLEYTPTENSSQHDQCAVNL